MINIVNRCNKIINTIKNENSNLEILIVIKGIDIELINGQRVNLNECILNKRRYIRELMDDFNIISFDEYVFFKDILHNMFDEIYIIDNNIYGNYYPINADLDEEIVKKLLEFFDQDMQNESELMEEVQVYTDIYGNLTEIDNQIYVVYNSYLIDEKVKHIAIFENNNIDNIFYKYEHEQIEGFIIRDEIDYIKFITKIFKEDLREVHLIADIRSNNYLWLKEKIDYLINYLEIDIVISSYNNSKKTKESYDEYLIYLKKYWNKDKFLNIKFYDNEDLQQNKKTIYEVSQGVIIDSIVKQSIKARNNEEFSDIFVTAPTGAGKSVMFQIPAIYLSEIEEDPLITIVISPLIGLMNDQVKGLELKDYSYARTINSDISPIEKEKIKNDILNRKCHILYISPETLLSRSDVDQLIGDRKIGLFVIDEAHIVTTWGKQFRPDYWFLGDHIKKIRKKQETEKQSSFPIATFSATIIYNGVEDMYSETINSLNMIDQIKFLGYVKRDDITIDINKISTTEYENDKFENLISLIMKYILQNKKVLIYFPTVRLINDFYNYCQIKGVDTYVTTYHGQLTKYEKNKNYENFYNKEKNIMLATKAFGMGIDIENIEIVIHFAPTGNVCDYIQEIGRAARSKNIHGEAYYEYDSKDFKYINRLHGLSSIKEYQLVKVIKKVYELYVKKNNSYEGKGKRDLLVDARDFSYIFENPMSSEDDIINKVKTAMLLIQKDFERRGYAPFYIRPIPLFSIGYFCICEDIRNKINKKYFDCVKLIDIENEICSVNLQQIWEKSFSKKFSFPQFKYMIYSNDEKLDFIYKSNLIPSLIINIDFNKDSKEGYRVLDKIREVINACIRSEKFYSVNDLVEKVKLKLGYVRSDERYKLQGIIEVIINSMLIYGNNYANFIQGKMITYRETKNRNTIYCFKNAVRKYFEWLDGKIKYINENLRDNHIYLVNNGINDKFGQFLLVLGVLESLEIATYDSKSGGNSQIYIRINETKTMKNIIERPYKYKNRLLDQINKRHNLSVLMLTYLFENSFSSEQIWDYIEDYFLGKIPQKVKNDYKKKYNIDLEGNLI